MKLITDPVKISKRRRDSQIMFSLMIIGVYVSILCLVANLSFSYGLLITSATIMLASAVNLRYWDLVARLEGIQ